MIAISSILKEPDEQGSSTAFYYVDKKRSRTSPAVMLGGMDGYLVD